MDKPIKNIRIHYRRVIIYFDLNEERFLSLIKSLAQAKEIDSSKDFSLLDVDKILKKLGKDYWERMQFIIDYLRDSSYIK